MRRYDLPRGLTDRQEKTPLPKLPHSGSPRFVSSARKLRRGMKMLEDFGFRTETNMIASPRLSLRLGDGDKKPSEPLLHVTDLWSQRQQMEFLQKTGLRRAQMEREKQVRREAFLQAREKIEGSHAHDQLYERILAEDDPVEAGKMYAAGPKGRLLKQLHNQVSANSPKVSIPKYVSHRSNSEMTLRSPFSKRQGPIGKFEELVSKCDDTILRTSKSRQYSPRRELCRTYISFLDAKTKKNRLQVTSFDLSAK